MGYLKNELTGFVPVEQATEIIKMVTRGSSVLRMAKVEEMKHEKKKFKRTYRRSWVLTGSVRVKELRQAVLLGFTLKSRRRS